MQWFISILASLPSILYLFHQLDIFTIDKMLLNKNHNQNNQNNQKNNNKKNNHQNNPLAVINLSACYTTYAILCS